MKFQNTVVAALNHMFKMSQEDKAKLTEIIRNLEEAVKSELICKGKIKKYGQKCKFTSS